MSNESTRATYLRFKLVCQIPAIAQGLLSKLSSRLLLHIQEHLSILQIMSLSIEGFRRARLKLLASEEGLLPHTLQVSKPPVGTCGVTDLKLPKFVQVVFRLPISTLQVFRKNLCSTCAPVGTGLQLCNSDSVYPVQPGVDNFHVQPKKNTASLSNIRFNCPYNDGAHPL